MINLLFCFLLTACTGIFAAEDYVYELHVILPRSVGQDQIKGMKSIQKIITDNMNRNDSYVFKHVARPEVFAFLTIETVWIWKRISDALTVRGYVYDVTPLRNAKDYAEEIGIPDIPSPKQPAELDKTKQYAIWRVDFPQKDRANADYRALVKRHLTKLKDFEVKDDEVCWIVMAREPVSAIAVTRYTPRGAYIMEKECVTDDEVEESRVQLICNYMTHFQKLPPLIKVMKRSCSD